MTSLAPAFWSAIFAAFLLAIAKHLAEGMLKTILLFVGVASLAFALAWGLLALIDRLNPVLYSIGDVAEKLLYPEIAILDKYSKLTPEQIEARQFDESMRVLFIDDQGNPDWRIDFMGRSLSSDWIKEYLEKSLAYYPDLPALRKNNDGTAANSDERAFVYYLKALEKVLPRKGRPFIWAEGETPDLFLASYYG